MTTSSVTGGERIIQIQLGTDTEKKLNALKDDCDFIIGLERIGNKIGGYWLLIKR